MVSLPTLPRRSWLERSSHLIAATLVVIGSLTLVGWWLHLDSLVQPFSTGASIKANDALCVLLLGLAMLAVDRRWGTALWIAVAPVIIAGATLAQNVFQ